MTEVTTFRKVFVEEMKDWDENKISGYVYLTEGQDKPTSDEYMDHYLHIVKNDYKHKHYGNKDYMLFVDRSEYSSNDISELEKYLFDWAEGEYHEGEYIIRDLDIHNLFEFEKASDPQIEDSQYTFKANNDLYIQVCEAEEYGDATTYHVNRLVWMDNDCVGESFGNFKDLHDAMEKVLELHQERSIDNQFPEFDDMEGFDKLLSELAKYDFVDECWHNEAMPHVCKMMPTTKYPERAMRIWIDWKDKNKSELYHDATKDEVFYRFNVHLQGEYGDESTTEIEDGFETLEEVLKFVKDYFESNVAKWTPLHEEWNEWLNKQDNIDDKEADAQGVITCYTLTEDQKEFVTDFIERWDQ